MLEQRLREAGGVAASPSGGDLFEGSEDFVSIDGHAHTSRERQQICQWLYLAGVLHATQRQLPVEENLKADFFLPLNQVFIDFWSADATPTELKAQMRRAEVYKKQSWNAIELHPEDIAQLDDVMPRQLHKFGVKFS